MTSGLAILALLMFRVLLGVGGSRSARFVSFVRGPRAVIAYVQSLRRGPLPRYPGHNPAGGWMVVLLLAVGLVQALTGLFSHDSISTAGPLTERVSEATIIFMTALHHYTVYVLLACVSLHLLAIAFYLWFKRENLVSTMLTGRVPRISGQDLDPGRGGTLFALVALVLSAAFVCGLVYLA